MKPLDFIIVNDTGSMAMITEVSTTQGRYSARVKFIHRDTHEHVAWYPESEITVINNLPNMLSQSLRHPFSMDSLQPFEELN